MSDDTSRKRVVLTADDSEFFRSLIGYAMRQEGIDVVEAGSGQEAMALLASDRPIDAVLLDLMMPPPNGFAVLEAIRELTHRKEVPVIVLSQYGLNSLELDILEQNGIRAMLAKSTTMDRILFEVNQALYPRDAEQRKHPRAAAALGVTVKRGTETAMTTTFNLSESGMFLVSSEREPPRPGSSVDLRFWVPGAEQLFTAAARVVWVNAPGAAVRRSHPAGYAVEFVRPGSETLTAIRDFIRQSALTA